MNTLQAIDLLNRLIATPSVSRDEAAAADLMQAEFERWGFVPKRKGNNRKTQRCVDARSLHAER